MGIWRDVARDFVDMQLHRLGIRPRERESRALALRGANRAEQICIVVALVGWLTGPGSGARPLMNEPILLSDAGLILEPQFDRRISGDLCEMSIQCGRKVFLNASMISTSCPG